MVPVPTSPAKNGSEGRMKKHTCFPCALGKAAKTPLLIRFTKIKINFLISKESKSQKIKREFTKQEIVNLQG